MVGSLAPVPSRIYAEMCALSLAIALSACGGSDDGANAPAGDAEQGAQVAQTNACPGCHGDDLAGSDTLVPGMTTPNLTPDRATGLGNWSDEQIANAILNGIDNKGKALCDTMARYKEQMTAREVSDLVAYLRSVPPVSLALPQDTCD
jgi:mono/diheme cytochrome c family protein